MACPMDGVTVLRHGMIRARLQLLGQVEPALGQVFPSCSTAPVLDAGGLAQAALGFRPISL